VKGAATFFVVTPAEVDQAIERASALAEADD
jgi:hypothetical protein